MRAHAARVAPTVVAVRASEPVEDGAVEGMAAAAASSQLAAVDAIPAPSVTGFDGDESPRWPDEASESAFLAEQKNELAPTPSQAASVASSTQSPTVPKEMDNAPLPNLQTLVDRIPADAKATLEELFRARFVSVKRIQNKALK